MTSTFFITDDTHSLCNVKERFAELESERDQYIDALWAEPMHRGDFSSLEGFIDYVYTAGGYMMADWEHAEEFAQLQSILDQVYTCALDNDEMLINEAYFTEYCAELCEDIGAVPNGTPDYITRNIDWGGVASELMQDYSAIEVGGVTFYYRTC